MSQEQATKLDADESIFFGRQLESVKAKSYDVMYPELKARTLIPVSYSAGPGAETIKYEQYDQVGMAKIIASYADDLPRADIKGKEFIASIKSIGASYGYSVQEIRAARYANKPLEQRRANAAKRAIMQKENQIAFMGDAASGLQGLLTHANITIYTLPQDGVQNGTTASTAAAAKFINKTPDQVLRDLNAFANGIVATTFGVEAPDTLLLPIGTKNYLTSTARSQFSDASILKYFLDNQSFIKNVEWLNELSSLTGAGVDSMLAYKRDPDKLTLEIPQDFEQFPAEPRGLEFMIACHERIGGVLVYYPLSVTRADGI